MKITSFVLFFLFLTSGNLMYSQVRPNHIFDNNMVLQRDQPIRIWGSAAPLEKIKIEFGGQIKSANANKQGEWFIYLDPMIASAQPRKMNVSGIKSLVQFTNVLVGDVWILGGQSNMELDLAALYHGDAEILSANFPNIRLMTIPSSADHLPKKDFERINEYDSWHERYDMKGYWFPCSPKSVTTFSGLGYIFGRRIHMASKIPIGLIDLSLGGTTVEAWLSPNTLLSMPENNSLLKQWNDKEAAFNPVEDLKTKISNWEKRTAEQKRKGEETAPKPLVASVRPALDRNFPGSSYTGMVAIIGGLSVKGVVFHQGYNNALGDARPKLYAANFKALISDWRNLFNNKQLPFGIIEFSAGGEPQTLDNYELRMLDPSPYIREGQFNAYRGISNTGYACAYDQQVNWYHPQKKVELGERMARWALSTQYGFNLGWEPAVVEGIEKLKDKIIVTFSKQVKSSDDRPMEGFSIAGIDRHFYPAKAEYLKMQNEKGQKVNDKRRVIVWNDLVENPIELRYAWARNPLGNLVNDAERIIPVPLFRTDNWEYPEAPYLSSEYELYRQKQKTIQQQAEQLARIRIIQEAEKLIKENKK